MTDPKEIEAALDLEFWFDREGVPHKLTRGSSGMQINTRECPCCGNTNWKVYLNVETGLGNCFRCDEKFNKLKFIQKHKDLTFPETLRHVGEVLSEQGWRPRRATTAAVEMGVIKLPFSIELPTREGQNLTYLEGRGITGDLAAYFHLRFCEEGWWNYVEPDTGERKGQKFSNRVLIPIFDLDGSLRTFQGRDIIGDQTPKYLFPKALPSAGRYLYNAHNAIKTKRVVMGEGAFDVFGLKIAMDEDVGLRDVVPIGSFGKHLSFGSADGDDQLGRLLKLKAGGLEEVTILWDGERDALRSALKAAERIQRLGLAARVGLLPEGKDPNETSADKVRSAFYEARSFSPGLMVEWMLRNPYPEKRKQ